MPEQYFNGFSFQPFNEKPFTFKVSERVAETPLPDRIKPENIKLDDLLEIWVTEELPTSWNPRRVRTEFKKQLAILSKQIDHPLTLDGRRIRFVTPEQMRPKTEEQRQLLIDRYGEYIRDGGVGSCTRYIDGTFRLRIGYLREESISQDEVLETMAHEYGHSLGPFLDSAIFEELKAYAFSDLVMRQFYGVSELLYIQMTVSNVHETARFYLEQLIEHDIPPEAILAHLIGSVFGRYKPNDYLLSKKN